MMKVTININGVEREYQYDPLTDWDLLIQEFVDDVKQYEEEQALDHNNDQKINDV